MIDNNTPYNFFVCALGVSKYYVRIEKKDKTRSLASKIFFIESKEYYFGLSRNCEDTVIIAGKSFYKGSISNCHYIRTYYNYDNELKVYDSTIMAELAIIDYIKKYNEKEAEKIAEKKQNELDKEFVLRFTEYQYP